MPSNSLPGDATAPSRTSLPRVTVAAIVEDAGRFLIVEESVRGRHCLNQPAGHLEPDESLLDAVRRECFEETGARVVPEALVGIYQWQAGGNGRRVVRFAFDCRLEDIDESAALDDGIIAAHWLTQAEIERHTLPVRSPLVVANVRDFLTGNRYSLDLLRRLSPL